jgi:hypothetical protein
MTFAQLIDKYGTIVEFYLDETSDIEVFAKDAESAIHDFFAKNLRVSLGNTNKTAILKEAYAPPFVKLIKEVWDRADYWYNKGSYPGVGISNSLKSSQFWEKFVKTSKYEVDLGGNIKISETALLLKDENFNDIYDGNLGYFFAYFSPLILSREGGNPLVKELTAIKFNISKLEMAFKQSIMKFNLVLYGVSISPDSEIIEDLQHSTIGNWKDLPPLPERKDALLEFENNLNASVESEEYQSYKIEDFGTFTRITTIPYKTDPYDAEFKINGII